MSETPEERYERLSSGPSVCLSRESFIAEIRSAEAAAREEERERCIEALYRLQDEHISIAFWGEVIGKGIDAIRTLMGEEKS